LSTVAESSPNRLGSNRVREDAGAPAVGVGLAALVAGDSLLPVASERFGLHAAADRTRSTEAAT
jgi:hypothetical protein